jgi:hypothetical protein
MIQNIFRKSLLVTVQKFDWASFMNGLSGDGYTGLIYGVKNDLLERLGLRSDQIPSSALYPTKGSFYGDLFIPDPETTVYLKVSGQRSSDESSINEDNVWEDPGTSSGTNYLKLRFEAGEVSPISAGDGSKLALLIQAVNKQLLSTGVKEKGLDWTETGGGAISTPPFAASAAPRPDQHSLDLAAIFRDGKLQNFLERFAGETNSIVLDDYLGSVPNREETEYYIDKLFEADFITEEIVVYCRKSGAPTIRAKDRAALDALSEQGISCSCGEPLQNETIRRLILLPAKSRPLASWTWAAKTFLINMLLKLGYQDKNIYLADNLKHSEIAYVASEGKGLVFVLAKDDFGEPVARELWASLGKKTDNLKIFAYSAKSFENAVMDKLNQRFGQESLLTIQSLEDFNTKLLDALNNERLGNILSTFNDFQNQLKIDIAKLALVKFEN